jgi:hypothetical protein
MKIKVGGTVDGKEVDLEKALPITIGDLRKLKKLGVSYPNTFDARDPDQAAAFILYFCQKVVPEITSEEVDLMDISDSLDVMNFIVRTKEGIDRPTSTASTALPITTDGAVAT